MLATFNIPPKLHHFILIFWRKLPVASKMFRFHIVTSPDCSLCCLPEGHLDILKC